MRSFSRGPRKPAPILCVTPLPIANETHPVVAERTLEDYRGIVRYLCREHRVAEGPDLMPKRPTTLHEDGLHPTWIGARYVGAPAGAHHRGDARRAVGDR
jgi:hypothetical protein